MRSIAAVSALLRTDVSPFSSRLVQRSETVRPEKHSPALNAVHGGSGCGLTILTLFTGSRLLLERYLPALEALKKPSGAQLLFLTNSPDPSFLKILKRLTPDALHFPETLPADAARDASAQSQILKARLCARMYEHAKAFIKGKDLLILEHDVIPPARALEALEETRRSRRADFISAGIVSRITGEYQAWRLRYDQRSARRVSLGRSPKRVLATGFGFLLTESRHFLAMPMTAKDPRYPFFGCDLNGGIWARRNGLRWFVDGGIRCAHLLDTGEPALPGALANTVTGSLALLRSEERVP